MEKTEPKVPKPPELKKLALESWENEGGEIPSVTKTHNLPSHPNQRASEKISGFPSRSS